MAVDTALNAGGSARPVERPAEALLGLGRRFGRLLVSPHRLFAELRERPAWLAPVLATTLVGILAIVLLPDQVFVDGMEGATTRRGEPVPITSDPAVVALWERLRLSLGVAVTTPVKILLFAGLLSIVFGRRAEGPEFRHFFALGAHVWLISALGALLALGAQLASGDATLQPTLALAWPALAEAGAVGRLIAAVNPFTAWMLAVAGLGVGALTRRPGRLPVAVLLGVYATTLAALVAMGAR